MWSTISVMGTQTIERPDTDVKERPDADATDMGDDDTPKFFHYVKKNKIAESAVMGNHVVALCGETFPVTRSAKRPRASASCAFACGAWSKRALSRYPLAFNSNRSTR